ncbi:MAG: hypothetical protein GX621_16305, partial [Pirellulaceae bacterium]|nr:hypothetical protein [Pirellulaceae bacterium]
AFALDAVGKTPKGYNRLHVDLNRNGDLTDDKPFATKDIENEASANQTTSQSTFDGIKVPIERDGVKADHVFGMFVHYMELPQFSRTTVQMRSLVYREGEIRHGGRKIRVLLLDQNSNGLFDDRVSFRNASSYLRISYGDLLLINPKLRGSRSAMSTGQDAHFVNKTVCVGNTFYKLDISPLGESVKFEPTELAVGYVSNRGSVYRAVVCCDDFGVMEIAGTRNQKIVLPAGKWQIASYTLGVSGGDATIVSASFAGKPSEVDVEKGGTTELPFGPPFRAVVTAARAEGGKLGLSLSVVGQGGERCSNFLVGGKRPPAPLFEVRDASGKVVYSGKFEYG